MLQPGDGGEETREEKEKGQRQQVQRVWREGRGIDRCVRERTEIVTGYELYAMRREIKNRK